MAFIFYVLRSTAIFLNAYPEDVLLSEYHGYPINNQALDPEKMMASRAKSKFLG